MNHFSNDDDEIFDDAVEQTIKLGNQLLDADKEADHWDVSSGVLAGAVHFWLYAHQPCDDPSCESCSEFGTAELRLKLLLDEVKRVAMGSEHYQSPNDTNVGRA